MDEISQEKLLETYEKFMKIRASMSKANKRYLLTSFFYLVFSYFCISVYLIISVILSGTFVSYSALFFQKEIIEFYFPNYRDSFITSSENKIL